MDELAGRNMDAYGAADGIVEFMDAFLAGLVGAARKRLLPDPEPAWPQLVREVHACLDTPGHGEVDSFLDGPDSRLFTEDLVTWAVHRIVMDSLLESFFYQQRP